MERAVTLVGDDPVIFEHLGDVRFKAGQIEPAIEAWRRALAINPDNAALKQKINDAQQARAVAAGCCGNRDPRRRSDRAGRVARRSGPGRPGRGCSGGDLPVAAGAQPGVEFRAGGRGGSDLLRSARGFVPRRSLARLLRGFRLDLLDPLDRPLAIVFADAGRIVQYRPGQRLAASLAVFPADCGGIDPADWVQPVIASSIAPVAGERLADRALWGGDRVLERRRGPELRQSVRYHDAGARARPSLVTCIAAKSPRSS